MQLMSNIIFQAEAVPESLKNMLLVMDTAGVFECPEDGNNPEKCHMWHITWDRINAFLPGLKDELFKQPVPKTVEEPENTNCTEKVLPPPKEISESVPKSNLKTRS